MWSWRRVSYKEEEEEEYKGTQTATYPMVPEKAVGYNYSTLTNYLN